MSNQFNPVFHVEHDIAPALLPAKILRNDNEALQAAHELAQVARRQAAQRDRERALPWDEIELFTRSGLGSISVPKQYGGPEVSFATIAEVFRIISAADPALGQIPQNQFGILQLLSLTATDDQQAVIFRSVGRRAHRQRRPRARQQRHPDLEGAHHAQRRRLSPER